MKGCLAVSQKEQTKGGRVTHSLSHVYGIRADTVYDKAEPGTICDVGYSDEIFNLDHAFTKSNLTGESIALVGKVK